MTPSVKLYDLAPSPNNIRVRVGLGYKKIAYERIAIDPMDRSNLVEISGQPLATASGTSQSAVEGILRLPIIPIVWTHLAKFKIVAMGNPS